MGSGELVNSEAAGDSYWKPERMRRQPRNFVPFEGVSVPGDLDGPNPFPVAIRK